MFLFSLCYSLKMHTLGFDLVFPKRVIIEVFCVCSRWGAHNQSLMVDELTLVLLHFPSKTPLLGLKEFKGVVVELVISDDGDEESTSDDDEQSLSHFD